MKNRNIFTRRVNRDVHSLHFIGIGGIGMSGLAKVLLEMGYRISGSDVRRNSLIRGLEEKGAIIYEGHSPSYPARADLVVASSIIPFDNPELEEARRRKIPIISRGRLLSYFVNSGEGIVVAGTHGKTTTTCLIYVIFKQAGKDPTAFVGGELNDTGGNSEFGGDKYVVAESDESDGSFLLLSAKIAVLTSLEDDHLDYYGSEDKLIKTFREFGERLKSGGTLIVNKDEKNLRKVLKEVSLNSSQKVVTYGINSEANLSAYSIKLEKFGCSYRVRYKGKPLGEVNLPLPGQYNIYNSLAAISVGRMLGIPWRKIKDALYSFQGVKRRFERVGETRSGILVIDDYAHHPTEIKATLKVAKKLGRRIIAVFQPHRYTRTKLLLDKFALSFQKADVLLLTDVYPAGEAPIPGVSGKLLFDVV
ncbi:MAG: UDP-N-acetylmuramate--L-alanine ligase, partial [Candidatus Aerophobetes bacterium]|nr:UDP-N-acetylmuramate--L-alanine ligase [Candidatus Aerophobetes bacterium]